MPDAYHRLWPAAICPHTHALSAMLLRHAFSIRESCCVRRVCLPCTSSEAQATVRSGHAALAPHSWLRHLDQHLASAVPALKICMGLAAGAAGRRSCRATTAAVMVPRPRAHTQNVGRSPPRGPVGARPGPRQHCTCQTGSRAAGCSPSAVHGEGPADAGRVDGTPAQQGAYVGQLCAAWLDEHHPEAGAQPKGSCQLAAQVRQWVRCA